MSRHTRVPRDQKTGRFRRPSTDTNQQRLFQMTDEDNKRLADMQKQTNEKAVTLDPTHIDPEFLTLEVYLDGGHATAFTVQVRNSDLARLHRRWVEFIENRLRAITVNDDRGIIAGPLLTRELQESLRHINPVSMLRVRQATPPK